MGLIMGAEISEHSSACHKKSCKILWVPIRDADRVRIIKPLHVAPPRPAPTKPRGWQN